MTKYVATKIQTAPANPKIPPGRNPLSKLKYNQKRIAINTDSSIIFCLQLTHSHLLESL